MPGERQSAMIEDHVGNKRSARPGAASLMGSLELGARVPREKESACIQSIDFFDRFSLRQAFPICDLWRREFELDKDNHLETGSLPSGWSSLAMNARGARSHDAYLFLFNIGRMHATSRIATSRERRLAFPRFYLDANRRVACMRALAY